MNFSIEYEESPASANGISVWVKVSIGEVFPYVLDIDEFFHSLREEGRSELFTCECGCFGCSGDFGDSIENSGGYSVGTVHGKRNWMWFDQYHPLRENSLIGTGVCLISWNAVIREARKLLAVLEKLHLEDPSAKLFSGTYGNDIAENLGQYHTILEQLTQKLEGHQL